MAKSKKKAEVLDTQVELQEEALVEVLDVEPIPTPELPVEEKNMEELLLAYIDKQKEEEVELNDFFEKSYSIPEAPLVAKMVYQLLVKLSYEGKIKMSNTNWNDLGKQYHNEDGKSKKYLLSDIKILAKK
jgi:hypothetical protein